MSIRQGDQIRELVAKVKTQDFQAFARLLTVVERMGVSCLRTQELLRPSKAAFRVGITGPPGAGKSTIIGQLIGGFRKRNLKVGILAVDPSSPFSNGAILGDRIRYSDHFNDPEVFIRSIGSRGSLGGLSAAAYLMLRAYDVAGFDIVLIETVGVGQTELEIMHVADLVSVVLVPESGDSIQAMKAGLLEIADQFIVNKSDRPGADSMVRELEASVHLGMGAEGKEAVTVVKTSAVEGKGIETLVEYYLAQARSTEVLANRNSKERLKWEAKALLRSQYENQIEQQVSGIERAEDYLALFKL